MAAHKPCRTALMVLSVFCGWEWVNHTILTGRNTFLGFPANPDRHDLIFVRLVELAEMFLNLQYEPGFDEWLQTFKHADVQAYFAELEIAKILKQKGLAIRFHKASGLQDRLNFDLFIFSQGRKFPAEIKCKVETNELSKTQIIKTLKRARSQLPANEQSVIFLRVPGSWFTIKDSSPVQLVTSAIEEFLSRTRYVVSVIFMGSLFTEHGLMRFNTPFISEVRNKRADISPVLRHLDGAFQGYVPGWTYLPFFLGHIKEPEFRTMENARTMIGSTTE